MESLESILQEFNLQNYLVLMEAQNIDYNVSNNEDIWSWLKWILAKVLFPVTFPVMVLKFLFYKTTSRSLKGKVVLITGASSGLGEALAHEFYSQGCKVILVSRRLEELERVKNDLLRLYSTCPTYPPVVLTMDISDLTSVSSKVKEIFNIYQRIDILVNNAGVSFRGSIESTSLDVHIKVMVTNYFGQVSLIKAVLPYMIEQQEGQILVISSLQGLVGLPFRSAYAASKHALQGFCDALRSEIATHNIKVTVVSPSYIQTNLSLNALTSNGGRYGVMDKSTSEGMSPQNCASSILKSIIRQDKELIIAPLIPRLLVYIRFLFPQLYFYLMKKRAIDQNKKL